MKNVTKGEVEIFNAADGFVYIITSTTNDICRMEPTNKEANATLICEAFNIHNSTGLSPKELLEQRNELREALKDIINCQLSPIKTLANLNGAISEAKRLITAIKNCKQ